MGLTRVTPRLALAAMLVCLASAGRASEREAVPAECLAGRYLAVPGDGAATYAPLVVHDGLVSLGERCAPVKARIRRGRGGWRLTAVWPRCAGLRGRVRLRGTFDDDCETVSARLVTRRRHDRLVLDAHRSACGDGLMDEDGGEECDGNEGSLVALRFDAVPVPVGAVVRSAAVQFRAAAPGGGDARLEIEGEAADGSAPPLTGARHEISMRPRTAARVPWSPPPWHATGSAGAEQRTPDVAAIVQEIVDRPGWRPGASLGLFISGTGSRLATAADADAAAVTLHVEYDVGAPGARAVPEVATAMTAGTSSVVVVERRVAASRDDAEERPAGSVERTSHDLELVEHDGEVDLVGLRFTALDVPPQAIVTSAYVQFQADDPGDAPTVLRVEGEAAASAAAFADVMHDLSTRPRTAAAVSWLPPPWPTDGDAGPEQRTPDLSPIVQELVDGSGWRAGNAVVLLVSGSGRRVAEAYDGKPGAAPLLHVEYVLAGPTSTVTSTSTTTITSTSDTAPSTVTTTSSTVPHRASVDVRLATGMSDAEEDGDGAVVVAGSTLLLGERATAGCGRGSCSDDCACGGDADPSVSFTAVQPILTARCATPTCHGGEHPEQGLDLRAGAAHRALVGVASVECPPSMLVAPRAPDASYLMRKLQGRGDCFTGIRMPPGSALPRSELTTIRRWIAQGASDD